MSDVSETPAKAAKPPCYRQAFYRKQLGQINEQEYFHYIFQHLSKTGIKHKGDEYSHRELEDIDPLGYSLNQWIVNTEPVDGKLHSTPHPTTMELKIVDTVPFERVFATFRNGAVDDVKTAVENLSPSHQHNVRKSLALFALQERNATVLQWLLDDSIEIEEGFEDEVRRVQKKADPLTWKLLKDHEEKTKRPWAKHKRPRGGHPLEWDK